MKRSHTARWLVVVLTIHIGCSQGGDEEEDSSECTSDDVCTDEGAKASRRKNGSNGPKTSDEPAAGCAVGADCESGVCDAGTHRCSAPTATDGVKNGDETDVDCGGPTSGAQRCDAGKGCGVHEDCSSNGCGYDKKCTAKSCAQHHGGDTCGPASSQESCCVALDVPGPSGTYQLDKYPITAGRFRQFVERTGGDIRGYIQNNRPSWWESGWDAYVPSVMDDGSYVSHEGIYQELGPGLFYDVAGGNQGCETESYGARTFFVPAARSRQLWDEEQHYEQDELDEKAMQCATFFMFAAFCAWDGGRLPTLAELDYAYTGGAANPDVTHKYPWGSTPVPAGWNDSWSSAGQAQSNGVVLPAGGDQTFASFAFNSWAPAGRHCGMKNGSEWCDYTVHVPPPGRFPNGNGPFGHADLGGLVFNLTSDLSGAPGTSPENRSVVWGRNGSWEGHAIPFYAFQSPPRAFKSTSKYRSTGARCAR